MRDSEWKVAMMGLRHELQSVGCTRFRGIAREKEPDATYNLGWLALI